MPPGFCSWSTKIPPLALIPTGQSNLVRARGCAAKGGSAQAFQHCSGWLSSHVVNQIKELVWLRTILPEGKRKRLVFSQLVPTTGSAGARESVEAELLPELVLVYTRFNQAGKNGLQVTGPCWCPGAPFQIQLFPSASVPAAATAVLV